jgi:hypothetical protein
MSKFVGNSCLMLKGSSGTGKGTRVNQLLSFFISKGYSYEKVFSKVVHYDKKNEIQTILDKEIETGLYFKDLNMFFLGMYKVSNKSGLTSWSSLDIYHSKMGAEATSIFLNRLVSNYTNTLFIFEGYPLTFSYRYRPIFLFNDTGFKNIYLQYYVYGENKQDYLDRIYGRSGEYPKGDAAWNSNLSAKGEYGSLSKFILANSKEEKNRLSSMGYKTYEEFLKSLPEYMIGLYKFSDPVTSCGSFVLNTLMKDKHLCKEFLDYSIKNSCLRHVDSKL